MNIIMSRAIQQYNHRLPPTPKPANSSASSTAIAPTPIAGASSSSSLLDFTDRIPFRELSLSSETIGSGSFGTVFKGRWQGQNVAVKQFKTREEIDSFLVEVKQLSCVKHPNIVTLYGASTLADTAYLIMEYAEGGSLNHLLHECKQQEYDLRHACSWAMQTARGVAYLHEFSPKPIMHRDLKPANLLLFLRGKILKICDFGTACTVTTQMTNNTGSASYMAPEVFATSSYLESGDVFSWSIIFWEILARRHPYSQQYSNPYQILWRVKQEGARPNELESCPKIIWRLITKSWNKDPKKRPTMRQVADEMALIFSLTEKSSSGRQRSRSPRQLLPVCSHLGENQNQNRNQNQIQIQSSQQQILSTVEMNSQSSSTRSSSRELYVHSRALKYKIEMLKGRYDELVNLNSKEQKDSVDSLLEELSDLNKETTLKEEELKLTLSQRYSNHYNT